MTDFFDKLNRFAESLRPRLFLWVALIVVAPRVVFLAVEPGRNVYGNAPGELAVARNIAEGRGYANASGQPDSDFNPGYPTFLSVCQRLFGDSLWPIKIAHIAFDVGTAIALTWVLAASCSTLTLLLFALAFALHPLFLLLCNNVNDEPLLTFLIALSFARLYRALRQPTTGRFALAGLTVGLAIFTKSTAMFLPLFLAGAFWLILRRTCQCSWRHWAAYLVTAIAVLLPWSYRNYVTLGHFAFNVRGIGQNLWFGSDPRIFTRYGKAQRAEAATLAADMTARGIQSPASSNVYDREHWLLRMAIQRYEDLLHHPIDLAYVMWLKGTRSLYASEDRPSGHLPMILLQVPTLLLALYGLARLWKRAETRTLAWLLTFYVFYYYSVVSVGMPMVRYFVPAVPFLLAAAAAGVTALARATESPSPRLDNLELAQS
ncbi:MAG TPA: glycosyltransferase family 39 protein [Verrucomicrobiae bacterium]|nr:glycosyltransferase family 39 protein [Verrucomicrobiae bacterium]